MNIRDWEIFVDKSYYDLWAVRPVGEKNFNSGLTFHVLLKEEAQRLKEYLESNSIKDKEYEV